MKYSRRQIQLPPSMARNGRPLRAFVILLDSFGEDAQRRVLSIARTENECSLASGSFPMTDEPIHSCGRGAEAPPRLCAVLDPVEDGPRCPYPTTNASNDADAATNPSSTCNESTTKGRHCSIEFFGNGRIFQSFQSTFL